MKRAIRLPGVRGCSEEVGFKLRCIQLTKIGKAIPWIVLQIHGVLGASCVGENYKLF